MALGIGANTAIFSVVNAVLLRRLPYPQADRLLVASLVNPRNPSFTVSYGVADYLAARERQRSFTGLAGVSWTDSFTLTGAAGPLRVHGSMVSAEFFMVLGISPALGRGFAPGEDTPGHAREVVLSDRFWRQHFGADPQAVDRTVALNGESYTIVGVLPANFNFSALDATDNGDLWPLMQIAPRNAHYPFSLRVMGRLKPGVTEAQARLDLSAIAPNVQRQFNSQVPIFPAPPPNCCKRISQERCARHYCFSSALWDSCFSSLTSMSRIWRSRARWLAVASWQSAPQWEPEDFALPGRSSRSPCLLPFLGFFWLSGAFVEL